MKWRCRVVNQPVGYVHIKCFALDFHQHDSSRNSGQTCFIAFRETARMVTGSAAGRASELCTLPQSARRGRCWRIARVRSCQRYTTFKKHLLRSNYIYTFTLLRTFLKRVNVTLRQCFLPMINQYKQYKLRMGDMKLPPTCR